MMGIGFSEMLIIAGIALVLLGPEKFPEFAKMAVRAWRDLQKYMDEMKMEIAKEVKPLERELREVTKKAEEIYKEALEDVDADDNYYSAYSNKGYSSPQYLEHAVTTSSASEPPSDSKTSEGKDTSSDTYIEPYDPDVPQADLSRDSVSYPHSDEEIYNKEDTPTENRRKTGQSEQLEDGEDISEESKIEFPERLDG
ncbi:MAG: Sec-independent protein translocase protein TatB [Candidatus Hydrogenedentes bacterium]|nr:Sec-independent protein translocase protein TatB [Candidatus Hydrogenedentota bacterium]